MTNNLKNPQPFESKHLYYPGIRDSNFLSNVLKISEKNYPKEQVKSIFSWGNINYLCEYKDASLHCKNTDLYSNQMAQGPMSLVVTKDTNQKIFVEVTQAKQAPKKASDFKNLDQIEASTFGVAALLVGSVLLKKFKHFLG